MASLPVYAGEDDEEEEGGDLDGGGETNNRRGGRSISVNEGTVREIQRGFFGKANVGGMGYVGLFGTTQSPGMMVNLSLGQDFVDQEKASMSWEIQLSQGVNDGVDYITQGSTGCSALGGPVPCTEGDIRTYTVEAFYEYSYYPGRRFGIGIRAGGGVLYSPLLMFPDAYNTEVLGEFGLESAPPNWHGSPHGIVRAGPTFEYYTKLAHFSIGADTDFFYGLGWGMGWDASGYFKYTFGKKQKSTEG